jgi:N-acylneuraminate cytidylyltransferase/CMP-N,N'-diacetyllegionaminic acid synthase
MGKPLIVHSLEQAKASGLFSALAVSSDSDRILEISQEWGADFLIKRPEELATDQAAKLPAIRHCVSKAEEAIGGLFEIVVDLDATSPLRSIADIHAAVQMLESDDVDNVITAMPARRSPYFNVVEIASDGTPELAKQTEVQIVARQNAPKCFDMNASIYVWRREVLFSSDTLFNKKTRLYVMPEERSFDIDSELDFRIVEFIMMHDLHLQKTLGAGQ